MLAFLHTPFHRFALALCVVLLASAADAAWVTIKNDSTKTIVVQETTLMNGEVKRGKPTTLMPGESVREFLATPGVKQIDVFDASAPQKPIWTGPLNCKDETQTYSVTSAAGKLVVSPVAPPPKK